MDTPDKEWKTLSLYSDFNDLYDNFVIAWLPVDDTKPLKDTLMFPFCRWQITTVGLYNGYRQREFTNTYTQPTFCFIDKNSKPYGQIIGYTNDKEEVETFIKSGFTK